MKIKQGLKLFVASFVLLVCVDFLWVGVIAHQFYDSELGTLARRMNGALSASVPALVIVYAIMALGLVLYVLPHATRVGWAKAFIWGALFGFVVYGTYDATNYSIIVDYSLKMSFVDVLWGCMLSGIVTTIVSRFAKAKA